MRSGSIRYELMKKNVKCIIGKYWWSFDNCIPNINCECLLTPVQETVGPDPTLSPETNSSTSTQEDLLTPVCYLYSARRPEQDHDSVLKTNLLDLQEHCLIVQPPHLTWKAEWKQLPSGPEVTPSGSVCQTWYRRSASEIWAGLWKPRSIYRLNLKHPQTNTWASFTTFHLE